MATKRKYIPLVWALLFGPTSPSATGADIGTNAASGRMKIDFNSGWLFSNKKIVNAESLELNEKLFRPVVLPHTVATVPHKSIDTSSFSGISWYRKHFFVPVEFSNKRIVIEFEGVAKVAEVFLNGRQVAVHKGSYTPFTCDISETALFGKENVLAVRVDSRQRKDIPPEGKDVDYLIGGGIIRDVAMIITDRLYIDWAYARLDTASGKRIHVTVRMVNCHRERKSGAVRIVTVNDKGEVCSEEERHFSMEPAADDEIDMTTGPIDNLRLWHPDDPYLYTISVKLLEGDVCLDDYRMKFGCRSVKFEKTDGKFYINNIPLKLRGLNRHETFPFICRAAANRLQARDADIIKYEFGCNVARCSHYPQDPRFLDRCDEIGLMVLEEMAGWNFAGDEKEWQSVAIDNLKAMIIRDRNHPSIISFGVRINQSADFPGFYRETNSLARMLDPDRPTHGVRVQGRGFKQCFFEDVWAQNFAIPASAPPFMPWITTEYAGHTCPARSWDDGSTLLRQMLAHAAAQDSIYSNPFIAGGIGWCAFDYNSPYSYSESSVCYHGVADMFRMPKHAAYFYRSQADPTIYGPMVYIAHYWDEALVPDDIWVVSNCDSVELFVNGRSMGKKRGTEYLSLPYPLYVWRGVPFCSGDLRAVGYIGARAAATFVRKTPTRPVRLTIKPDDTLLCGGGDMTRIVVCAVDSSGQAVRRISPLVRLSVKGPAYFLGEPRIALEDGKTAFFIQTKSTGAAKVVCSAQAANLEGAKAVITVKSADCSTR